MKRADYESMPAVPAALWREEDLSRLGPLLPGEAEFPARVRLHQAWYRLVVQGAQTYGRLPPPSSRMLGSVLSPEDARRGRNFTSTAARRYFERRHSQGWGVDPFRCAAVMTSSQTLTLNVFGLLAADSAWAIRVLSELLATPLTAVDIEVEVAQPVLLKHSTHVDVLTTVQARAGWSALVGWEVKLCDRYTSRNLALGAPYANLLDGSRVWRPNTLSQVTRQLNALFRCHALVESLSLERRVSPGGPFILLRHDADPKAPGITAAYRELLTDRTRFIDCPLSRMFAIMAEACTSDAQRESVRELDHRYLGFANSEPAWQTYTR